MNNQNYQISLNFLALKEQEFCFTIFRRTDDFLPEQAEKSMYYKVKLPTENKEKDEEWKSYWIKFSEDCSFEPFECSSLDNPLLTIHFLYETIKDKCISLLSYDNYFINRKSFEKKISIFTGHDAVGSETIDIVPYFLKNSSQFGILIDFHFRCKVEFKGTKIAQQKSLSLDMNYGVNKNFYLDKYEKIKNFVRKNEVMDILFPFVDNRGKEINVMGSLTRLPANVLKPRKYIFGNQKQSNDKFQGLKQLGPLEGLQSQPSFYFAFAESSREYVVDLYKALRGSFQSAFPGMEMFETYLGTENTKRSEIQNFSKTSVAKMIHDIEESRSELPVQIAVIESKNDDSYFELKHQLLKAKIPHQIVTLDLLKSKSSFKWSVSNIGLQIFAKLGGQPWKVQSENPNCLIIGISQSHTFQQQEGKTIIKKFFSYSVLLDSTGLYQDIKVLGISSNQTSYMKQMRASIQEIVEIYSQKFNQIIIHTPFKINYKDLKNITDTLDGLSENEIYSKIDFSVIKINTKNKFFGYYTDSNGLVPYESSYLEISNKEYLLWLEGINKNDMSLRKRYSGPVHIEFYYSNTRLSSQQKMIILQDIINLSGANWRGFNAQSFPISIYYCKLIADLLVNLREKGYSDTNIEDFRPWFL